MTTRQTLASLLVFTLALLPTLAACDHAQMGGNNDKSKGKDKDKGAAAAAGNADPAGGTTPSATDSADAGALSLTCGKNPALTTIPAAPDAPLRLSGQVCATGAAAAGASDVIFVIDFSGSMDQNDPAGRNGCGRLSAAAALVASFQKSGADARFAVVSFSSDARVQSPFVAMADVDSLLVPENFCEIEGSTNYQAAFETTASIIEPNRTTSIYFMSDGEPRMGHSGGGGFGGGLGGLGGLLGSLLGRAPANDAETAGLEAAQQLKKDNPDSTLFAVFLTPRDSHDGSPADARSYMESLTADKSHVAVATSAADLATQIVKFPTPAPIVPMSVEVTLTAPGSAPQKIAATLAEPGKPASVIAFTTDPFDLIGGKEKPVVNTLTATVTDSQGKTHQSPAYQLTYSTP